MQVATDNMSYRHVVFLLFWGDSPASEFYVPTFRKNLPKRRHIKFIRRGITQKKQYDIQNTKKGLNREPIVCFPLLTFTTEFNKFLKVF